MLEEGERINDFYLEPVLFHNENGPTIGVTTCGVIVQDGLFFKDMDNDGILSPYEDWRNSHEVRAADMVRHLPLQQQAGLVLNTLWNTPLSPTREDAKDQQGSIVPSKIFKKYDPSEEIPKGILPGLDNRVDDAQVIDMKLTAGTDVIGGNYDVENIVKAAEDGYLPKADLDRANYRRLLKFIPPC